MPRDSVLNNTSNVDDNLTNFEGDADDMWKRWTTKDDSFILESLELELLPNSYRLAWISMLLAVTGLTTNISFCLVVLHTKQLHVSCHVLMSNLAFCNVFYMLLHVPYYIDSLILDRQWRYGWFMCKAMFTSGYIGSTGSFYFMAAISLNRWATVYARKGLTKNKVILFIGEWVREHTKVLASVCWIATFLVSLAPFRMAHLDIDEVVINELDGMESVVHCRGQILNLVQILTLIFFQYGVPILVLIPTNIQLCVFIWNKVPVGNRLPKNKRRAFWRRVRLVSSLLMLMFVELVAWVPIFMVAVLQELNKKTSFAWYAYAKLICLSGILITPVIYLVSEGMRDILLNTPLILLLPKRWRPRRLPPPPPVEIPEAVLRARRKRHQAMNQQAETNRSKSTHENAPLISPRVAFVRETVMDDIVIVHPEPRHIIEFSLPQVMIEIPDDVLANEEFEFIDQEVEFVTEVLSKVFRETATQIATVDELVSSERDAVEVVQIVSDDKDVVLDVDSTLKVDGGRAIAPLADLAEDIPEDYVGFRCRPHSGQVCINGGANN